MCACVFKMRAKKKTQITITKKIYSIETDVCAIFESRGLHCIVLYFGYAYDTAKQKAWIE